MIIVSDFGKGFFLGGNTALCLPQLSGGQLSRSSDPRACRRRARAHSLRQYGPSFLCTQAPVDSPCAARRVISAGSRAACIKPIGTVADSAVKAVINRTRSLGRSRS